MLYSQHIVDGKPRGSKTTRNVINPTTEEVLATVPVADRELLDETVVAASCAFHAWASTPMETRQAAVTDLGKLVLANLNEFAELLIKEVGKSRELAYVLRYCHEGFDQRLNPMSLTSQEYRNKHIWCLATRGCRRVATRRSSLRG